MAEISLPPCFRLLCAKFFVRGNHLYYILLISPPRLFGGPILMEPFIFERRRFRRTNFDLVEKYTDSEVFEETKVARVFLYIHDLVYILGYILLTSICRNLKNQHLRLDTNGIQIRLIETIPAIVRVSGDRRETKNVFLGYGVRTVTYPRLRSAWHLLLIVDRTVLQKCLTRDESLNYFS